MREADKEAVMLMIFRRLIDAYPSVPLLYVCSREGVTGIVRAMDFDDVVRWQRRLYQYGKCNKVALPYRPQVFPLFLFSDKPTHKTFRFGTMEEMGLLVKDCDMETRDFFIPFLRNRENHGWYGIMDQSDWGRKKKGIHSYEDAHTYIHGEMVGTYCQPS